MLSFLFLALSLLCFPCYAENLGSDAEILVHLSTASPLHSAYLGKLQAHNSAFSTSYLNQLEEVLAFDLAHNAETKLLARSSEKDQILYGADAAIALQPTTWKQFGAAYVFRWHIHQRALTASVLNVETGSVKTFSDIALSGDLNHDRRQIHKLADAFHKALFDREGIAHSRILYAYQIKNPKSDGTGWLSEIWECDWDGANAKQITHEGSYSITPVVIPQNLRYNNDRFLYVSYKMGQPKIYIGSLKGGESTRLVDLRGNQLLPAISQQRDKIAFICDAAGRTDLFLQPLDPKTGEAGKPTQLYSHPRSTQASPTFSPDGTQIAFVSDKDGGMRIYLIPSTPSTNRANAVMISKQNRENSCPCWSPDGTKLAYSAKTGGIRQIWIYDFDKQEEWQLTSGPGNKENPQWGPNSRHIVFNSTDRENSEIYIVNLKQPEAIKISKGSGKKHYPAWGTR